MKKIVEQHVRSITRNIESPTWRVLNQMKRGLTERVGPINKAISTVRRRGKKI